MEEGRLVAWKKREGDAVKSGETLAEVETDKAVMELVAREDGVLRKIVVAEGATVPVSALVAIVGRADEDIASLLGVPASHPTLPGCGLAGCRGAPCDGREGAYRGTGSRSGRTRHNPQPTTHQRPVPRPLLAPGAPPRCGQGPGPQARPRHRARPAG